MRKIISAIVVIGIAILSFGYFKTNLKLSSSTTPLQVQNNYSKIPLYFEKNAGQADPQIDFISRGQGYGFYVKATESFLNIENNLLSMKLENANEKAKAHGLEKQTAKVNYLSGSDPKNWKTGISTYAKVQYNNIYPGIDVIYYGNQQKIEYDFVVAPHADYSQIKLKFNGAEKLAVNEAGNLVLTVAEGKELIQQKPEIYQEKNNQRQKVEGSYVLQGEDEVAFVVAAYDREKTLVIDPTLFYSTYLGGSGWDAGYGIAVDSAGSTYVTGYTSSINFPTNNAYQVNFGGGLKDVFVAKFSPDGSSLIYSTYLGGNEEEWANGIAVDPSGSAYVTGFTKSADFPTNNAYQTSFGGGSGCPGSGICPDAFVSKLSADGSTLIYSSYLGGNNEDMGQGIAVDSTGSAYVTGFTSSVDFLTNITYQTNLSGSRDAFVAKFSTDGSSLIYASYLGGNGIDTGRGIAIDSTGSAYVTGDTTSVGVFPANNSYQLGSVFLQDAFVAKFSTDGSSLIYASFLGGNDGDEGYGITVDAVGSAYVTGTTLSNDFATANVYQENFGGGTAYGGDAFVAKLSPDGSSLVYATYLGGSLGERGCGIAVDTTGSAHVAGWTMSTDFPIQNAYQSNFSGCMGTCSNAFVTQLSADGSSLIFSTYLAGNAHDAAHGIALDSLGSVYAVGFSQSSNFPTTSNAYQPNLGSAFNADAFVLKFDTSCGNEVCDGVDNDCDGQVDNGVGSIWYQDLDGDGYGNSAVSVQDCNPRPSGYVQVSGDCHDGKPHVNPGRAEICNHSDDNCNNQIDEGFWWSGKECLKLQFKKSPFPPVPPKKQNKK